ncbi:methyltransferase domain-containing protein [Algibacter sp. L1A34]|uniref:methyltransferase domain-containing protein n=1 Tax=Algibacter sp. L1A34 TaxID=2686365 RepID=UPI00131E611E|nr:methyltransferase domain-containing protein [Algibacter sp. L1A34]
MNKKTLIFKDRLVFANEMLAKYFPLAPNSIISDIGAGFGALESSVKEIGGVWQPFDYVRKIDKSIIWDLTYSCPGNAKKAGLVLFLEVLEHLPNPLLSLQNISNHMVQDGYLILTTPNPRSSKNIINLMLKGTLYAFQEKHIKEYHVFTPWEHIVKDFLKTAGFEILEYTVVDTAYQKRKHDNYKDRFKRIIEVFFEKRNVKSIGMSYGIIAKKVK